MARLSMDQSNMNGQDSNIQFNPIVCVDCGKDNLSTLVTSEIDHKTRCQHCHDKYMMTYDIPKCGKCDKPVPFGHVYKNAIYCDDCYRELIVNKLHANGTILPSDKSAWEVSGATYEPFNLDCKSTNKIQQSEINNDIKQDDIQQIKDILYANTEQKYKDIGETHMTPERQQILDELQQYALCHSNQSQQFNKTDYKSKPISTYKFTGNIKSRKPIKNTKIGGWLSTIKSNIKDGWNEMMVDSEEIEVSKVVNSDNVISADDKGKIIDVESVPNEINEVTKNGLDSEVI